uniref:Alpha-carbonic anhydrase domain-containing protein n=1 Tax=Syphacia muris TaxID=451379 RepID=A0A0N5APZ9_9BILA
MQLSRTAVVIVISLCLFPGYCCDDSGIKVWSYHEDTATVTYILPRSRFRTTLLAKQFCSNFLNFNYFLYYPRPSKWGILSQKWWMCSKGKLQSPININPKQIIYDSNLPPLMTDENLALIDLVNTGQMPRIRIANTQRWPSLNVTGGPLGIYRYRLLRVDIHYSMNETTGSEHSFDHKKLPMELQAIAINSEIYGNFSAALNNPHGIVGISTFVKLGKHTSKELKLLSDKVHQISYKRQAVVMQNFALWKLLPTNAGYITYEGSMTTPGCQETVTWILLNQPLHISVRTLDRWRKLQKTLTSNGKNLFIAPNYRSLQSTNGRIIRTNIRMNPDNNDGHCLTNIRTLSYNLNDNR